MKTAKKLLAILLAMLMIIGCVGLTAFADPEDEEEWDCSTLGHEFVDGECIHCFEPDPDWESDEEWDCSTMGHEFVDGECIHCFEPDPDWEDPGEEWDCYNDGHDYVNGSCIYCGKEDPALTPVELSLGDNQVHVFGYSVDYIVCSFTSSQSGWYLFTSSSAGNSDPCAESMPDGTTYDDCGGSMDFRFYANLTADSVYMFKVWDNSEESDIVISIAASDESAIPTAELSLGDNELQYDYENWDRIVCSFTAAIAGTYLFSTHCDTEDPYGIFDDCDIDDNYTFNENNHNFIYEADLKADETFSFSVKDLINSDSVIINVELVYVVTLDPGEGSGEPIVFRSCDQDEFPIWRYSEDFHFFLEDDGRMGFRLNTDCCPDTFTAPEGYVFDDWQNAATFNTLSSTNTVFTALWKAIPANYSLSPSEYTIENSGYTDITCSFDSLYLGHVTNRYGIEEKAQYISFYMNGGTLTDGNGNSIPFLVDDQFHFGANNKKNIGYALFSPEDTFIMSVWIDPEVFDSATPGTYTGELVYDSEWRVGGGEISGESGSIALTLVIPEPSIEGPSITATISATEVVRGDKLTWNVSTPKNVTWLKFNGTDENGNAYTSYYKYSNYNKGTTEASVTDTEDGRVWNIPMVFNYAGTQAVDNQTWTIEYRVSGSNEWKSAPGEPFNIKVGKNAAALAPAPEGEEYAPYSIIEANYSTANDNGADYIYFIVRTTDDVSKVKVSYVNETTGKTKTATYQTTSTNVYDHFDSNGFSFWVIRMKVTAPAVNNEYTIQVRGSSWGEGVVATESEMIG